MSGRLYLTGASIACTTSTFQFLTLGAALRHVFSCLSPPCCRSPPVKKTTASSGWTTSSRPRSLQSLPYRPAMVPSPPLRASSLGPRSTSSRFPLRSSSRYCKPLCCSSSSSSSSRRPAWAASSWPWGSRPSRRALPWQPPPAPPRPSCCRARPPSCKGQQASSFFLLSAQIQQLFFPRNSV